MDWKIKASIIATILTIFCAMGYIIKMQHDQIQKQKDIETSVVAMKVLTDGIVRNQAQYASKDDLQKFAKDNAVDLTPIQNNLKTLQASISSISVVNVITPGKDIDNTPSTSTGDINPNPVKDPVDKYGYFNKQQVYALNEPFNDKVNVPWGSAKFSAWQQNPWSLDIYSRDYKSATVLGVDDSGRHYAYSQMTIVSNGKEYKLPIGAANYVEQYPDAKWRWGFTPYLGISAGVDFPKATGEIVPNLGISFLTHGKNVLSPDFMFLGLGIGYEARQNNAAIMFSPINYNLNGVISFLHNTYIGPDISVDFSGQYGILLGVRTAL
jgi:hypothetical protein